MQSAPTVFIVEDDAAVRGSLEWLIGSAGLRTCGFADAESFLAAYDPNQPGCVVADMGLPGANALEIQRRLSSDGPGLPVIIITGQNDLPLVVAAMRSGAVDCLQKPVNDQRLLQQIHTCITRDEESRKDWAERALILKRIASLTARELEVMLRVVDGAFSRQIAEALNLSCKTVESHRARVMDKMQADGIAALVRMVERVGGADGLDKLPDQKP